MSQTTSCVESCAVSLNRDAFLRTLIRELSGSLQDVVGLVNAEGYISVVGGAIGQQINRMYLEALGQDRLSKHDVAEVLVDLKRRIEGQFSIVSVDDEKIVFRNTACPFGAKVLDRPSLCMMTSNVFGHIASDNCGYAKVELKKTIANHDGHCEVIVYLKQTSESENVSGREYFSAR